MQPNVFVGVDLARKDSDMSAEAVVKRKPDGTLEIVSFHSWRKTIDLTPETPKAKL